MLFGKIDKKNKCNRKCIWLQLYWHIGIFHSILIKNKIYIFKLWMKQSKIKMNGWLSLTAEEKLTRFKAIISSFSQIKSMSFLHTLPNWTTQIPEHAPRLTLVRQTHSPALNLVKPMLLVGLLK